MLLYFAITCVLNLCLGYILGVYIGVFPGLSRRVHFDKDAANEWSDSYNDHHTFALGDPEPVTELDPLNRTASETDFSSVLPAEHPTAQDVDDFSSTTGELDDSNSVYSMNLDQRPSPTAGPKVEAPFEAAQTMATNPTELRQGTASDDDLESASDRADSLVEEADQEEALEELIGAADGVSSQTSA